MNFRSLPWRHMPQPAAPATRRLLPVTALALLMAGTSPLAADPARDISRSIDSMGNAVNRNLGNWLDVRREPTAKRRTAPRSAKPTTTKTTAAKPAATTPAATTPADKPATAAAVPVPPERPDAATAKVDAKTDVQTGATTAAVADPAPAPVPTPTPAPEKALAPETATSDPGAAKPEDSAAKATPAEAKSSEAKAKPFEMKEAAAPKPAVAPVPPPVPEEKAEAAAPVPLPTPAPERVAALPPPAPAQAVEPKDTKEQAKAEPTICPELSNENLGVFTAMEVKTTETACTVDRGVTLSAVRMKDGRLVELQPAAVMRCAMAASVAQWLRDKVEPAVATLGSPLDKVLVAGSLQCRPRNHVAGAKISEHGRGNALDTRGYALKDGRRFVIGPAAKGTSEVEMPVAFQEKLKASACADFTTILGPGSDGYHEQHLHVDRAERRSGAVLCQWATARVEEAVPKPAKKPAEVKSNADDDDVAAEREAHQPGAGATPDSAGKSQ